MNYRILITLFLLILLNTRSFSQNCIDLSSNETIKDAQLKGIIHSWCEVNFKNCFGWAYIDVYNINSDFSITPNGSLVLKGNTRSVGLFGREVIREFVATVKCVSETEIKVKFRKQEKFDYAPDDWVECERNIKF